MAEVLMKSISGIRGHVGNGLDLSLINQVAGAMANFTKRGTIIIGRDSRPSGESISMNLASSLNLLGCDVVDLGIVPTPTVQMMVEEFGADAGIIVSASHNPIEWNAFKLVNSHGTFFVPTQIKRFLKLMDKKEKTQKWNGIGKYRMDKSAGEVHIAAVLDMVDVKRIRKSKFKVVLDSVNGAGSVITRELLERLGCKVETIHCTPNGLFPRGAEPLPENLNDLSETVKKAGAHIGFAQDPDADRLAIVDEMGTPLGEEYTVVLAVEHILSTKKGPVVVNLSTTKAVEDIALKYSAPFSRTPVGEIHVVEGMKKNDALIGGEGNGGVIFPTVHGGRDSLVGIALVLEMMAHGKSSISEIRASMPNYFMKKGKLKIKKGQSLDKILKQVQGVFAGEKFSRIDGLRIDISKNEEFPNSWVHLRASNTEPIFRIMVEADSREKAERLYKYVLKVAR